MKSLSVKFFVLFIVIFAAVSAAPAPDPHRGYYRRGGYGRGFYPSYYRSPVVVVSPFSPFYFGGGFNPFFF